MVITEVGEADENNYVNLSATPNELMEAVNSGRPVFFRALNLNNIYDWSLAYVNTSGFNAIFKRFADNPYGNSVTVRFEKAQISEDDYDVMNKPMRYQKFIEDE